MRYSIRAFSQAAFDAASDAFHANKIRKGAMLYYKCEAEQKNGSQCKRLASQDEKFWHLDKHYCTQHAQLALKQRM